MSTTLSSQPASSGVRVNGRSPWIWALRRAIAGILILAITVAGAAWLLYAAIDPDIEASAEGSAALRKTTIVEAPARRGAATSRTGAVAAQ